MDRTERDILQVEMKYLRNFLIWQSVSSSFRRHFHLCPWHSCPIKRAFSLASHLLENRIDCVIVTTLCDTLKEIPSKRSNHDSISLLTFSCLVIELSALAFVYQDLCICLCFCLCLCLCVCHCHRQMIPAIHWPQWPCLSVCLFMVVMLVFECYWSASEPQALCYRTPKNMKHDRPHNWPHYQHHDTPKIAISVQFWFFRCFRTPFDLLDWEFIWDLESSITT